MLPESDYLSERYHIYTREIQLLVMRLLGLYDTSIEH